MNFPGEMTGVIPRKIFHIAGCGEVHSLTEEGVYCPEGFQREGFIHCSTRDQLVATANRIFASQSGLCVLEIDVTQVGCEIRYENLEGGTDLFPHIYGPLPMAAVDGIHSLRCDTDGEFVLPASLGESPHEIADWLLETVHRTSPALEELTDEFVELPPASGRWSPKEILGHLVDSALNNHGRFLRARWEQHLRHPGYDSEAWVDAGGYARAPWGELVELWRLLNIQMARHIAGLPEEELRRPRADHNLDEIAWRTVPAGDPVTLAYFTRDYIGHMHHHLAQIDPRLRMLNA